eukprot:COSAG04_NODE_2958_length_3346_cov_4.979366_1_plen_122_part_00
MKSRWGTGLDDSAGGASVRGLPPPVTFTLTLMFVGGLPPTSAADGAVAEGSAASVDSSTAVATSGFVSEPAGAAISCSVQSVRCCSLPRATVARAGGGLLRPRLSARRKKGGSGSVPALRT